MKSVVKCRGWGKKTGALHNKDDYEVSYCLMTSFNSPTLEMVKLTDEQEQSNNVNRDIFIETDE